LPHTDYLQFNTSITDSNDDKGFFQIDYSFIELVNRKESNSPWKAKAHEHFKNLSHLEMKSYLGMTGFKPQKF